MSDDDKALNPTEPETQPVDAQPLAPSDGPEPSDDELFMAALNGDMALDNEEYSFVPIKRGQTIKGTVAGKSETEILIDVGVKSEGIITGRELEDLDPEIRQSLRVGDDIMVYVLAPEDSSGHVQLSLKRAMEAQDWEEAEDYMKDVKLYESKVIGFNKGGLIVRFGKLRGFVPASQVSRDRQMRATGESPEERWTKMVGEDISVKVIEVDRGRKRLILSERAASKEMRAAKRSDLMNTLAVGQMHTGRVISLTDFGAFVDLGGADGLIHLSELSWEHIKHPKEVLNVGDEVKVEIINIDQEKQRIGLSRKKLLDDPWIAIASEFKPDQLVQGTITKLTKFGAFARLVDRPEIEGLIHISELSDKRISQAREVVEEGQVVTLRVLSIETDRRRLALSLKRAMSEEYMDSDWQETLDAANSDTAEAPTEPEALAPIVEEPETPVAKAKKTPKTVNNDQAEASAEPEAPAPTAEEQQAKVVDEPESSAAEEPESPVAKAAKTPKTVNDDQAEASTEPEAPASIAEEPQAKVADEPEAPAAEEPEVPVVEINETPAAEQEASPETSDPETPAENEPEAS